MTCPYQPPYAILNWEQQPCPSNPAEEPWDKAIVQAAQDSCFFVVTFHESIEHDKGAVSEFSACIEQIRTVQNCGHYHCTALA